MYLAVPFEYACSAVFCKRGFKGDYRDDAEEDEEKKQHKEKAVRFTSHILEYSIAYGTVMHVDMQ